MFTVHYTLWKKNGFKGSLADSFTLAHNFVDSQARRCDSSLMNLQENSSWEDDKVMIGQTRGSAQ